MPSTRPSPILDSKVDNALDLEPYLGLSHIVTRLERGSRRGYLRVRDRDLGVEGSEFEVLLMLLGAVGATGESEGHGSSPWISLKLRWVPV
jgi:hypothetical protein